MSFSISSKRQHIIKHEGSNFYLETSLTGRKTITNNRGGHIFNRWGLEDIIRNRYVPQKVRDCAIEHLAEEGIFCNG